MTIVTAPYDFRIGPYEAQDAAFRKWSLYDSHFSYVPAYGLATGRHKHPVYWQGITSSLLMWDDSSMQAIQQGLGVSDASWLLKTMPAFLPFTKPQIVKEYDTRLIAPDHPRVEIRCSHKQTKQSEHFGPAFASETGFFKDDDGFVHMRQRWLAVAKGLKKEAARQNNGPLIEDRQIRRPILNQAGHLRQHRTNIQLWAEGVNLAARKDSRLMITDWSVTIRYPDAKMVFRDRDSVASHIYEGQPQFHASISCLHQDETLLTTLIRAQDVRLIIELSASQTHWMVIILDNAFVSAVTPSLHPSSAHQDLAEMTCELISVMPEGYLQVIYGRPNDQS